MNFCDSKLNSENSEMVPTGEGSSGLTEDLEVQKNFDGDHRSEDLNDSFLDAVDEMTNKSNKLEISPRSSTGEEIRMNGTKKDELSESTSKSKAENSENSVGDETYGEIDALAETNNFSNSSCEGKKSLDEQHHNRSLFENTIDECQSPNQRDFKISLSEEYPSKQPLQSDSIDAFSCNNKMSASNDPEETDFLINSTSHNQHHHSSSQSENIIQSPLHSPIGLPTPNVFHNQMLNSHGLHGSHHLFGGSGSVNIHGGPANQSHPASSLACHSNPYFNSTHSFPTAEHWFWEQHRQNQQVMF